MADAHANNLPLAVIWSQFIGTRECEFKVADKNVAQMPGQAIDLCHEQFSNIPATAISSLPSFIVVTFE